MGEIWERAVETAIDGQTDVSSVRMLTLDGAVKCVHGRLPPPVLFEKFQNLQHFSIANIGVSSLEHFPRLQNLQKLILSDNRISGGLEFLVESGLNSLRDLDLSNNRIQDIDVLRPLAELKLVSLDLYECPVTRVKDYRSRVFGLIRSLKYLDKMDADGNERPESDDEDDEEEEYEDEDEDDPGSGEVDGEDGPYRMINGHTVGDEGIIDVDEDDESDADEEETETLRVVNGVGESSSSFYRHSNGFHVAAVGSEEAEEDEGEDDEENDSVEEGGDEEDLVEVHEIEESEDEDGVEDDDEEEVDNDEGESMEPESTGRLTSTEGEIDGHEHGEDGDEDDNGETEEEEQGVEEDLDLEDEEDGEDEEEDTGTDYLVQPVVQVEEGSDMEPRNDDEDEEDLELDEEVEDEEDSDATEPAHTCPSSHKRKRDEDNDSNEDDDDGVA